MARRVLHLTLPIEALLDVIVGKAVMKLPDNISPEIVLLSAFIDQGDQVLKITVTHPEFKEVPAGCYVSYEKIIVELKPEEPAPEPIKLEEPPRPEECDRNI